jgi:hypothetical protein
MRWQIKLPVRDPDEPLNAKAIGEIPDFLDGEDRDICREYLIWIKSINPTLFSTVGRAQLALEVLEPPERKHLLDRLRRAAGLPSTREAEQIQAQHLAMMHTHDRHEPVLKIMPGGAIVDVAAAAREAEAERSRERSRAAALEQQQAEADAAAAADAAIEAARTEELRRIAPPGVPTP